MFADPLHLLAPLRRPGLGAFDDPTDTPLSHGLDVDSGGSRGEQARAERAPPPRVSVTVGPLLEARNL